MNNFCENCGSKLLENTKFCGACGTPVNSIEHGMEETKPKRGCGCLVLIIFGLLIAGIVFLASMAETGKYGATYGEWLVETSEGKFFVEVGSEGLEIVTGYETQEIFVSQSSKISFLKDEGTFVAKSHNGDRIMTLSMKPGIRFLQQPMNKLDGHIRIEEDGQVLLDDDVVFKALSYNRERHVPESLVGTFKADLKVQNAFTKAGKEDVGKTVTLDFRLTDSYEIKDYESTDHMYENYEVWAYVSNKGSVSYMSIAEQEPAIDPELDNSRGYKDAYIEYQIYVVETNTGLSGYFEMYINGTLSYSGDASIVQQ